MCLWFKKWMLKKGINSSSNSFLRRNNLTVCFNNAKNKGVRYFYLGDAVSWEIGIESGFEIVDEFKEPRHKIVLMKDMGGLSRSRDIAGGDKEVKLVLAEFGTKSEAEDALVVLRYDLEQPAIKKFISLLILNFTLALLIFVVQNGRALIGEVGYTIGALMPPKHQQVSQSAPAPAFSQEEMKKLEEAIIRQGNSLGLPTN